MTLSALSLCTDLSVSDCCVFLFFWIHFVSLVCLVCPSPTHSGLFHQLAQMVLAELVFLCWTKSSALRVIQALKFVELVGGNMLAITNVAICVNLALIVSVSLASLLTVTRATRAAAANAF